MNPHALCLTSLTHIAIHPATLDVLVLSSGRLSVVWNSTGLATTLLCFDRSNITAPSATAPAVLASNADGTDPTGGEGSCSH